MSVIKLRYDVNEKPDIKTLVIVAMQHVLAMFSATILVPALINGTAGYPVLSVPTTLVASGVGTILYLIVTKGKSPGYLGSSFAYITPLAFGYLKAGIGGIFVGVIAVGLCYIIIGTLIKFTGKDWLDKLLPPVVIGPMIIIIGLSLASTVVNQIGLNTAGAIDIKELAVALVTFLTAAVIAVAGKGFLKASPFIIGIIIGYVLSFCLGMVDFYPIIEAPLFMIPNLILPIIDYTPNLDAILLIVPLAIVSIAEHIGTHYALGTMINKPLLKDPGLNKTLIGNGLAIVFAGLIGAPSSTIYGENTSVVGITKVASTRVIALASIIVVSLAFFGKASAIFVSIPSPVLGGITLLLYGFILINGFRVLFESRVDFSLMRNVIIASTMLIIGVGGAAFLIETKDVSIAISGMSLAAFVGILLNLFLPKENIE